MAIDTTTQLCFLTIREAADLIQRGEISPVELTRAFLDRIDSIDDDIRAFINILPESALIEARSAEAAVLRGGYRGPLHGIPIGLKDLYATKGVLTTANSRVLKNWVPEEDATATARLRSAGAVLLGKLNMSEFAIGGPDPSSLNPPARNPWNLNRMTGGSSTGAAAAIAARLAMGTLGSDTGGSIRSPASLCGVVGLKPTYGRVSRHGVVPLAWTLDHCGPLTATVEDAAIMLQAIAGQDPNDPTSSPAPVPDLSRTLSEDIRGLTIGIPSNYFFDADQPVDTESMDIVKATFAVLEKLGAKFQEITIPGIEYARPAYTAIMLSEAFAYHQRNLTTRPQDFGDYIRDRFRIGGLFSSADYIQAQRVRQRLTEEMSSVLRNVDVLVTPTSPRPAGTFESFDPFAAANGPSYTSPFNLTGLPALSVPCGFTTQGLPVGLQIVGKPFDEATVLRVGYAYQQAARWFEHTPTLEQQLG